jgi:hypothetical protein
MFRLQLNQIDNDDDDTKFERQKLMIFVLS